MSRSALMDFTVHKSDNTVHVSRVFAAPRGTVWSAWTEPDLLDQWWAPAPWKNETIRMDFQAGGQWFYAMRGPEGDAHYCVNDYLRITPEEAFESLDAFADQEGKPSADMPRSAWTIEFLPEGESTRVDIVIRYEKPEDLETVIQMGFREGFSQGLDQLDSLLADRTAA